MSDAHRDEINKLESLYAQNPEGRIFTHLAEAYRKAGELERAREVLTGGIERHPDYSSAHVVLGRVLVDLGQPDEARVEFRRVLELDGQNLVALRSLGDIARLEEREDEALMYYRRLLDQEPSDDEVREIIDAMTGEAPLAEPEVPAVEEPASDEWAPETSADLAGTVETADEPGTPSYQEATEEPPVYEPPASDDGLAEAPAHEATVEEPSYEAVDEGAEDGAPYEEPGFDEGGDEVPEEPEAGTSYAVSGFEEEAEEEAPTDEPPSPWEPEAGEEAEDAEADEEEPWAVAGDLDDPWTTGSADEEVAEEADTGWPFEEPAGVETEPEPEDADVMTETIAQVYARQGLYDRAVEVYEGLIRARPDDEGLRERLAEIEAQAAAETAAESAATEAEEPGGEPEESEALEGAGEDALAGEAGEAGDAPRTWAGEYGREAEDWDSGLELEPEFLAAEDDEDGPAVEPLEEELTPDAEEHPAGFESAEFITGDSDEVTPLAGLESEEVEADTGLVMTPDETAGEPDAEAGAGEPEHRAPEPEGPEPWEIPEEALDEALDEPDAAFAEAEEAPEGLETGAHESPWIEEEWSGDEEAETPYAWAETGEAAEDDSPPIHDYLQGLLRWGGGPVESTGPDAGAEAAPAGDASEAPAPGPEGEAGGDDDDLEMFRSWLESLKE